MEILGLKKLWDVTLGDPRVCIAVLDGPVDLSHPSLATANLTQFETLVSISANRGPALAHGTHITSVIFGQHDGSIKGVAPGCRGLIVPIFNDGIDGSIAPCSQLDLARAITQAVQEGANIINISGGALSSSATAHPILADVVKNCADNNVLIVAAVGNDGCDCLNVPGALPSVLAVGAMNAEGQPLDFSNWGERYQNQGILALGENVLGAKPGGGAIVYSGTSYATPFVSGIVALLLSIQLKRGQRLDPHIIREVILNSAIGCDEQSIAECRRLLAGQLNVEGALARIIKGENTMSDLTETQENNSAGAIENTDYTAPTTQTLPANMQVAASDSNSLKFTQAIPQSTTASPAVYPSEKNSTDIETAASSNIKAATCDTCASGGTPPQKVFALGKLAWHFGSEARRDSIMQHMKQPANLQDPKQLAAYLKDNPWDAASIIWTLNLDAIPIYAMQVQGGFARDICKRICEFLEQQDEIERISICGTLAGSVYLSNGYKVPLIWPELRGMNSWNNKALVEAVCGLSPSSKATKEEKFKYNANAQAVANFLQRVYEEHRNLGTTPQERAINYAATNALQSATAIKEAIDSGMELDTIEVERSPIYRPESDCWDVKLTFFNPSKVFEQARKVYRYTVDVSDTVPVNVGDCRSWCVR